MATNIIPQHQRPATLAAQALIEEEKKKGQMWIYFCFWQRAIIQGQIPTASY